MVHGNVDPAFSAVGRVLENQVRRHRGGAAVCVYFHGHPVVDAWAGRRSRHARWEAETGALSFSTTKGVTATALHILADRGLVDYDDPVAKHWPEFAANGKDRITLRQVLSHQAGLYRLRQLVDRGERLLDWDYMVHALERAEPAFEPGTQTAYHGLTFGWLVGEVVQRVSGRQFSAFVREEIAEPLGLKGLHIGSPSAEARALAAELGRPLDFIRSPDRFRFPVQVAGMMSRLFGIPVDLDFLRDALIPPDGGGVFWHPDVLEPAIPAGNGLFTARSLACLYAVLAAGGKSNGYRLLSARTVRRATSIQTRQRDRVILFRPNWRLGYHGALTSRGPLHGAFGHFGFGGSGAWADPSRQLAIAMVNNRAGGTPLGDLRILQIGAAAVQCADQAMARTSGTVARALRTA